VRKLLDKEVRYREQWYTAHVHVCSSCGETVSIDEVPTTKHPRCEKCNGALFNFKRWRRRGLARAIQQHHKHFFKFCIADEVHKTKSGDTTLVLPISACYLLSNIILHSLVLYLAVLLVACFTCFIGAHQKYADYMHRTIMFVGWITLVYGRKPGRRMSA